MDTKTNTGIVVNSFSGVRTRSRSAKTHVGETDKGKATNIVTKDSNNVDGKIGKDVCQNPDAIQSVIKGDDVKVISVNEDGDVNELQDDDVNVIKIRSFGDGIFENEDDDEDMEDDDIDFINFPAPEVELMEPTSSRKRKQDMSFVSIESALQEVLYEFQIEESFENGESTYRHTRKIPLYLLNPADYKHDPKKQLQIRRAIVTYRHHQLKKAKIKQLTEENTSLREYIQILKHKVRNLAGCGCRKNRGEDLKFLEQEPPRIPPSRYIPIKPKPPPELIPVGSNAANFSNKNSPLTPSPPPPTLGRPPAALTTVKKEIGEPIYQDPHKPLINIGPARLQQINSSTLSNINVVRHPFPAAKRPLLMNKQLNKSSNGPVPVQKFSPPGGTSFIRIKPELGTAEVTQGFIPIGLITTKVETATASQMLFGSKQGQILPSRDSTYSVNTAGYPRLSTSVGGTVAPSSGQTLKHVNPSKISPQKQPLKKFLPILPRPTSFSVSASPTYPTPTPNSNKIQPEPPLTRDDVKSMWTAMDNDDDDDELAIIAAIKNSCPETRTATVTATQSKNRSLNQQSFDKPGTSSKFSNFGSSDSPEIEFSKYSDIVFEEAD